MMVVKSNATDDGLAARDDGGDDKRFSERNHFVIPTCEL